MANTIRNYKNFIWHDQVIDETLVNTVRVRIFKKIDSIISTNYEKVVATDGKTIQKSSHTFRRYTEDYSYVILSTGICKKEYYSDSYYLYVKVYLADNFDISSLRDVDFPEKSYVLEALKTGALKPDLSPFLSYLQTKNGFDYEEIYQLLKSSAQSYNFNKVEELFKTYKIPEKYQAFFWKGMYRETAKKEDWLMRKNFKFRWKGLLKEHYPVATVNVKIYPKKNKIFIHQEDLVTTDGYVESGIVNKFTYIIVTKAIRRPENPDTYHLDIKVYLTRDFNQKYLPQLCEFWGGYVREAIINYLYSPKLP